MYEVETREQPEQHTAVVRGTVDRETLASWLSATYGTVTTHLQRIGVAVVGPPFARVLEEHDESTTLEAGVPVAEIIDGKDEVQPSTMPGGLVAVTWHEGGFDEVGAAREAIEEWLARTGAEPLGPPWLVHHDDLSAGERDGSWTTEVVQPIREP